MEEITWGGLTTVVGIALLLSGVILPIAKALGARGRGLLVAGLILGQVFAQAAAFLEAGVCSPEGVLNAFLVGIVGAASATGLYEGLRTARTG